MKKTKLTETAARIPDPRHKGWDEALSRYLQEVEGLNKESARSHRFSMFLQELLGLEPGFIEDYVSGIEQTLQVKQKDRLWRGRADNLFGNVIIEFEVDIPKKRKEAEEQLRRYAAILWSQEPADGRRPYLALATDGLRFLVYSPRSTEPKALELSPDQIDLRVLEETDWRKLKGPEVYFWLDRYFRRQEILSPTSEAIVRDFGEKSHAFQSSAQALLTLWTQIKDRTSFGVFYESWDKYLRIVYGSVVAGDELFVRHTYLATLAKLMAWRRLTESRTLPDEAGIVDMLEGRLFKQQGIENFIEEDFFSWPARSEARKTAAEVARGLFSLLQNYNLRELTEDVLKALYQELVDPATRHDLGEFYTPDWLAHRIVNKLLDEKQEGSVLDPACGSGTFLYLTIREKRERLGDAPKTLHHILGAVCGADIHPLAVIVAKTNYILALGDLLKKRKGSVTIPIYLANTIRLPEQLTQMAESGVYKIEIDSEEIWVNGELLKTELGLYDQAIEAAKDFAWQNRNQRATEEKFQVFLQAQGFPSADDEALVQSLFRIAESLKAFIEADRDTIWAFVLKNVYKPFFFKGKFDFVVGNPPWIAFRYLEPNYQAVLKKQITQEYGLLQARAHLMTHLEVAALFLVRAADLYLTSGGTVAFVLPRSLFTADQHDSLRRKTFILKEGPGLRLFWREIWDCDRVSPLFNVPACALFADKTLSDQAQYPLTGEVISGRLERKNASLLEAAQALTFEPVEFHLHTKGKRSYWAKDHAGKATGPSFYKKFFAQGATIVPRPFWFVRVKRSPLGFNPNMPPLEADPAVMAKSKKPYQNLRMDGNVESPFLYATLLATDLLPFGHLDFRLLVLPIEPAGRTYRLIDSEEAHHKGFYHLENWLKKVEAEWKDRRSSKSERFNALEWLDYRRKLTSQSPRKKFLITYNAAGTFLTCTVVKNKPVRFEIGAQALTAKGFLTDTTCYYWGTDIPAEAFYLGAVLNSPELDRLIKPMQSRGLWGPRHIHKKVLELPIPEFDPSSAVHRGLSELGEECTAQVERWLAGGGSGQVKSIGRLRAMVRNMLQADLQEIDVLVKEILG